jgi:histidine ammonia-lyase
MAPTVLLTGDTLTREEVINVAISNYIVEIDTSKLSASLDYITDKVKRNKIVYGVTTGFGSNTNKMIQSEDALELQINLLRSHACGVGKPFSREIVRAIMVIRLNTLLKGYSGVQESTVQQLAFLINNKIHPVIPEKGSVGASGDLCPLSHMALPLIGEGEIEYNGETFTTEDFLKSDQAKAMHFKAISLSYKEGLALNNGTTVMAAVATIALHKAENLIRVATLSTALIFESLCARGNAYWFDKVHQIRKHEGQIEIAQWLKKLLDGSKLIDITQKEIISHIIKNEQLPHAVKEDLQKLNPEALHDEQVPIPKNIIYKLRSEDLNDLADILQFAQFKWKPQDSYSIRCIPQVFGASKTAIDHAISIIDNELNAACDNPLIFPEDDKVVSGGNFHGQPIALVMDYLKLALAEIGNITERQINKMVDRNTNDCLPPFLIDGTGLNSGLMVTQYVAASIVSENKVLVHPASADSVPTCENTEDHVSMGTIAARQAIEIADNVEDIVTIAVMTGYYAIHLRMSQFEKVQMESSLKDLLAPATYEFYQAIRQANKPYQNDSFYTNDRFLAPEVKAVKANMGKFLAVANRYL